MLKQLKVQELSRLRESLRVPTFIMIANRYCLKSQILVVGGKQQIKLIYELNR